LLSHDTFLPGPTGLPRADHGEDISQSAGL
jgi:hypothetical protein